jgi:hypothetical protein
MPCWELGQGLAEVSVEGLAEVSVEGSAEVSAEGSAERLERKR